MAFVDSLYKTFMRRNSVYVAFILTGAFVGEKALTGSLDSLWESNNKGKLFKDLEKSLQSSE